MPSGSGGAGPGRGSRPASWWGPGWGRGPGRSRPTRRARRPGRHRAPAPSRRTRVTARPTATSRPARGDARVAVLDRVSVRTVDRVSGVRELVVADLSFISLTLVLPALVACAKPDADFVLLVKPQFEVGKGRVGAGGVVRETTDRSAAVRRVTEAAGQLGLGVLGVTARPRTGPAGSVEELGWLRREGPAVGEGRPRVALG